MTPRRIASKRGIAPLLVVGIFAAVAVALSMGAMLALGGVGLGLAANQPPPAEEGPPRVYVDYEYEDEGNGSEGPMAPETSTVSSAPSAPETTGTTDTVTSDEGRPRIASAHMIDADGNERPVEIIDDSRRESENGPAVEPPPDNGAAPLPAYEY